MSEELLKMEREVLDEGREWTRRRLQERLQAAADAIPPRMPSKRKAGLFSSGSKRPASR